MTEVKILMVGPKSSGKSSLSNFLADAVQNCETPSMAPTKPTVGTRILEFDRSVRKGTGSVNVSVELWDVSGDRAYEAAWPAIMHGAMGVIYVYDAGNAGEEKDLDQWHRWFGMTLGFKDSQCLIMGHRKSLEASSSRKGVPKSLAQVHFVSTTLEENHDLIKEEFDRFLVHVESAAHEMRQKEEQSVFD